LPANNDRIAFALVVVFAASGTVASAHRLDEFLQAARISVGAHHVDIEIDLTPGVAVADALIREIDGNTDGVLSRAEQRLYVERVENRLALRVNNSPLRLKVRETRFPRLDDLRSGDDGIHLRLQADLPTLEMGVHQLFFGNRHAFDNSVYLANALLPDVDTVVVTDQTRNYDQSEFTLTFAVRHEIPSRGTWWPWIGLAGGVVVALAATARRMQVSSRRTAQ
jgi:hypothetical protein